MQMKRKTTDDRTQQCRRAHTKTELDKEGNKGRTMLATIKLTIYAAWSLLVKFLQCFPGTRSMLFRKYLSLKWFIPVTIKCTRLGIHLTNPPAKQNNTAAFLYRQRLYFDTHYVLSYFF